jgi:hypothetical protein
MDKREVKENEFVDRLLRLTPRKVTQFIEMLSQDKQFDDEKDFIDGMKFYFISKVFIKLDIRVRIFESGHYKFITALDLCPVTGKPFVFISKKDSKNMNAAYAKLYDLHKDLLLELVEKHDAKLLELEVV